GGARVRVALGVPRPAAGGGRRRIDRRARPDPARPARHRRRRGAPADRCPPHRRRGRAAACRAYPCGRVPPNPGWLRAHLCGPGQILAGCALILAGAAAGLPALRRLLPPGTLTARPGLPATILTKGLLTFTFFGADAYVTLAVTAIRHRSPAFAGIAVTGATV